MSYSFGLCLQWLRICSWLKRYIKIWYCPRLSLLSYHGNRGNSGMDFHTMGANPTLNANRPSSGSEQTIVYISGTKYNFTNHVLSIFKKNLNLLQAFSSLCDFLDACNKIYVSKMPMYYKNKLAFTRHCRSVRHLLLTLCSLFCVKACSHDRAPLSL